MAKQLSNQQAVTVRKLQQQSETLRSTDIETLCSNDSVETIYAITARQDALDMAAKAIVNEGVAIKAQLQGNDVAQSSEGNTTDDVSRISGGTLAEVMTKITEILAGKTGNDLETGANNFAAMCEVLATQVSKCDEVVTVLAKDPVLVADVKDVLSKANNKAGKDAFDEAIEKNCSDAQKDKIAGVSDDELKGRREENKGNFEKQHYTGR